MIVKRLTLKVILGSHQIITAYIEYSDGHHIESKNNTYSEQLLKKFESKLWDQEFKFYNACLEVIIKDEINVILLYWEIEGFIKKFII